MSSSDAPRVEPVGERLEVEAVGSTGCLGEARRGEKTVDRGPGLHGLLFALRPGSPASAAFTAPAGLSIITTSFAEGPARNRALSIYTATGATGFSLGLVFRRSPDRDRLAVVSLPVPVALVALVGAIRLVPAGDRPVRSSRAFDLAGAVSLSATASRGSTPGRGSHALRRRLAGSRLRLANEIAAAGRRCRGRRPALADTCPLIREGAACRGRCPAISAVPVERVGERE